MAVKNLQVAPVVKWVGGKRQLLDVLRPLLPSRITHYVYCEPFLGGAAMLFDIQPRYAYVNDLNGDLIVLYQVIRDHVDKLIDVLKTHKNTPEYFYELRACDRNHDQFKAMTPVERAARLLYLNKTCYNGLFRVNSMGEFNAPFGRYKNPTIVNEKCLRAVSSYLNKAEVYFTSDDFSEILKQAEEDWFIYLDPPYDPISDTANFTGYNKGRFDRDEQIRLKECCDELHRRNIKFMLSNSCTEFIQELYSNPEYNITKVYAKRAINSNPRKRNPIPELIIRNYRR